MQLKFCDKDLYLSLFIFLIIQIYIFCMILTYLYQIPADVNVRLKVSLLNPFHFNFQHQQNQHQHLLNFLFEKVSLFSFSNSTEKPSGDNLPFSMFLSKKGKRRVLTCLFLSQTALVMHHLSIIKEFQSEISYMQTCEFLANLSSSRVTVF